MTPTVAVRLPASLRVSTFAQRATCFVVLAEKTARTRLTYRLSTVLALLASGLAYSVILLSSGCASITRIRSPARSRSRSSSRTS